MRKMNYDYQSDWMEYAYPEESKRFLTDDELIEMHCDCIDLNVKERPKTSGGIPVLFKDNKIYVLREGHTQVQGESGSKKTRTIGRGAIISATLNRDSIIFTDPKGEVCSDPKIAGFLKEQGMNVHVLDLRTFDKDGFNILAYPFECIKAGDESRASDSISKFIACMTEGKKANDDFWNDSAKLLIESSANLLLKALVQKERGEDSAHLASLMTYFMQDRELLKGVVGRIKEQLPEDTLYNPADTLLNIYNNPDKTYACLINSTLALLKDFKASPSLTKMMSISTFDIRKFYEEPSVLFLVVPDETSAYDALAGYLIDTMYQLLITTYTEKYQNKCEPPCRIHFECDEFANIRINDMGSKISASRSRGIEWTLIYQSEKQLKKSYEKDCDTIRGNCKNMLFLGSTDYEILKNISEQCGFTGHTLSGNREALVKVDDLRKMRKEWTYKDALLIRDNHLYTAKLPDYDQYPFLEKYKGATLSYDINVQNRGVCLYTPQNLNRDLKYQLVDFYSII